MSADAFAADRYLVKQLIRPMANLYEVYALGPGTDAPGSLVAFTRQKKLALKEDIRFFADDSEQNELFRIKARSVVDIGGRYDVTEGDGGAPIGTLERRLAASLLRTTWRVLAPDESELVTAVEKNVVVAIIRRVVDVPLPYHFTLSRDGRSVGEITRAFSVRDQYVLDVSGDVERAVDRRLAIALTIALDALQAR